MWVPMLIARLRSSAGRLAATPGQTMAEYAILIAVIAVIVVLAATLLGANVSKLFSSTGAHL
jgi:Flp pilus assembly pilin Flp